jgi:hypothetical protein
MAEAFPSVMRYPIEDTNTLLVASPAPLSPVRLARSARIVPGRLAALTRRAAAALEPRLEGGEVWTDDRAPVEWLVDASLLGYAQD